jgi:tRNA dimethylallyltransferase
MIQQHPQAPIHKNFIVILSGPTATGKTQLSLKLAPLINAEIVNFDSLNFYRELNIGTAKPSFIERQEVPHHLIDIASIRYPLNAADFTKMAMEVLKELSGKDKNVILVGGSGFYLRALRTGMYPAVTPANEIKQKSEFLYESEGIEPFRQILKSEDPDSYLRLHENDHYRIRRAVEHFWASGQTLTKAKNQLEEKLILKSDPFPWNTIHLFCDLPKDLHWKNIQLRTEKMVNEGLVEEVSLLLNNGISGNEKPMLSIGYKETQDYLKNIIPNLEALKERISISTRQLAKSQRTWFQKDTSKINISPETHNVSLLVKIIEQFRQENF